jgi:hypothetical protein
VASLTLPTLIKRLHTRLTILQFFVDMMAPR